MTFATKKYSGPVRKSVHVLSSDPSRPSVPLQVAAIIGSTPPTLGLDPEGGVDFERFAVDERPEARVVLTNFSPDPMRISIIGQPPAFLAASLSADVVAPRQTIELKVATTDDPPLGRFSGAVTLLLDEARNTRLTIPVSGISMMR